MPAKSKAQQRFFGMVHAYQKGELDNPSKAIKDAAESISKKDAKKFAETKHKGLPNHVKKDKKETNENVVRLNEAQFRAFVSDTIKSVIKEGAFDFRPSWNNCKNIHFVHHGEWSDPELACDDYLIDYYDVEDYISSCGVDINNDEEFKNYCQSHQEEIEDFIKENGKKEYNPFEDYDDALLEEKKVVKINEETIRQMVSESLRSLLKENMFEEDGFCLDINYLNLDDGHLTASMTYVFDEKPETAKETSDEVLDDIEYYLKSQDFLREHEECQNDSQVPIFSIESLPGHENYADGRCYISELDAQYKEEVEKATGAQVVVVPSPFA